MRAPSGCARVPEPPASAPRESDPARVAVRQRGVVGEERLDAEALQLVREPRRIGEQRARRFDLAGAAQMRDEVAQPIDIAERCKVAVAGLSEVRHQHAVELGEPLLDRALAQQGAQDVVQTQDAAAEIEVRTATTARPARTSRSSPSSGSSAAV